MNRALPIVVTTMLIRFACASDDRAPLQFDPELESQLRKSVTFCYPEASIPEAVSIVHAVSGLNIFADRKSTKDLQSVGAKFDDIPVKAALQWIMDKSELDAVACDGAIFVFKKDAYVRKKPETPPALSPDKIAEFDKAMTEINAYEFATRESATKAMIKIGVGAMPYIEKALTKDCDAETRLRLKQIVRRLAPRVIFDEATEITEKLDALTKTVSLEFDEKTLKDVIAFLENSGAKSLKLDEDAANLAITIRVADMSLGNAIRWAAREAGAVVYLKNGDIYFSKIK